MNAPRLARTRSGLALLLTVFGLSLAAVPAWSAAQGFYTVPPCRVYDTRNVGGNAVPIAQGEEREITIVDVCGIPADADAVSFNVTITSPTGPSHLTLYPKKGEVPPTSTINFVAGQTRANNIVLKLYNGGIVARPTMLAPGSVHVILDVNGYFVANAAATANDDDSVNLNNLPVLEDSGATALDVLANDSDPEGDPFFITSASDPANGTVVLTPPGGPYTGLTYQPDPNYCNAPPGTTLDTFTYTITGGDTAMVSVPVTCINDAPAPSGGPFSVAENAANGTSVGTVAHNDPDVGRPIPG